MTMADLHGREYSREGGDGNSNGAKGKKGNNGIKGGFQSLGLSDEVYRGISKMGFRVS